MKNTIKLIAAGAIALTAISAAQAEGIGGNGSQSFVGTMKISPGKYVSVTGFGNSSISGTINNVTIAGTLITQVGNYSVSSTVAQKGNSQKITNAQVLAAIYKQHNITTVPKNAKLVWIVEGSGAFESGTMAGLVTTGSGKNISYAATKALPVSEGIINPSFSIDGATIDLVVAKTAVITKKGSTVPSKVTSTFSTGIINADLLGISPINGVGTVTEIDDDPAGTSPQPKPLNITVSIPLSGTLPK